MSVPTSAKVRTVLSQTTGPAPWYWESFPEVRGHSGQQFLWDHHGNEGPMAYLVSLSLAQERERPRLALNTYCRPFAVSPDSLGIWCPEGRSLRLVTFAADQLKSFDFAEIAGWFKQSTDRIYAATEPAAELEVPVSLSAGVHKLDVPGELALVDELIAPTSYPARAADDPAFALFVFYLKAGLVEVLPQRWFTSSQYDVGRQWITRAARDPESQRIVGECFGKGNFVLEEDGCRLADWA